MDKRDTLDKTIFRVQHQENYFAVSRKTAQDSHLSFEARGVLFYLLSKCDTWELRVEDLKREGSIGRDKVYRILRELTAARYLRREKTQNLETGQWVWGDYLVYETPYPENPYPENPYPENPEILNNREFKKERESLSPVWAKAFEKHIGLATAKDVDFFRDLLKTYDETDIVYAIVSASKQDPELKFHAHKGIQAALDTLERERNFSKIDPALIAGIKSLIAGSGIAGNVLTAATAIHTMQRLHVFREYWTRANPIGKPDQRPHASQVVAYMPDALAWHERQQTPLSSKPVPHRTDPHCVFCEPRPDNPGAIGDGYFEFNGVKKHCPWCWSGVYDFLEKEKLTVIQSQKEIIHGHA